MIGYQVVEPRKGKLAAGIVGGTALGAAACFIPCCWPCAIAACVVPALQHKTCQVCNVQPSCAVLCCAAPRRAALGGQHGHMRGGPPLLPTFSAAAAAPRHCPRYAGWASGKPAGSNKPPLLSTQVPVYGWPEGVPPPAEMGKEEALGAAAPGAAPPAPPAPQEQAVV